MLLAVEHRRRESECIEAVQLLRDARERRTKIVGLLQLEIPAAGFICELAQAAVGARPLHSSWANGHLRLEADGVDHHFLGLAFEGRPLARGGSRCRRRR